MEEHSDEVKQRIAHLRAGRGVLLNVAKEVMVADAGRMFPLDFIMHMVAKRALSTLWGFASLIEQRNMVCARSLLRTQVDSMMRLNAFTLVDDPHALATKVIAGEHISNISDRSGQKMRDAYLLKQIAVSIPWVEEVYKRTSGFVHLSDEHLRFTGKLSGESTFSFQISEIDEVEDRWWLESIDCFADATKHIAGFISSWAKQKDLVGREREAEGGATD